MATLIGQISKISNDKRGRIYAQVQDKDTGQFFTVYPRKAEGPTLFDGLAVTQRATFNGTMHPLGTNVKLIARTVKPGPAIPGS